MAKIIKKLAILGQGLIGSSITRACFERKLADEIIITDNSPKVRRRLLELGLGAAKVVDTNGEAVKDADLIIGCVPVAAYAALVAEIAPYLKPGAILSDVGSVKLSIIEDTLKVLPKNVHFVPGHPLAGTEFSGPDAGLPKLFVNRWCILTPVPGTPDKATETLKALWEAMGSKVEIMTPGRHDRALAITSHLPHLAAFSIFHTALAEEEKSGSPVIQFSAGAFKDFTRIASSNPTMWRDIFLKNKEPLLDVFRKFIADMESCVEAIETDNGEMLEEFMSKSRLTRRKIIEKEHISLLPDEDDSDLADTIFRPYSSGD
ncbi:MAG: prephenate dehydrogenase/arogenate dehydrogenase family protein [Salaquimonas sp.]